MGKCTKSLLATALICSCFVAHAQTYVGSFKVEDGPIFNTNPPVYSGLEAAALLFGGNPSDYAISINANTTDPATISHTAYYTTWGVAGCQVQPEGYRLPTTPSNYNVGFAGGSSSAFVWDNCTDGSTNYVWSLKIAPAAIPQPVPSMALFGPWGLASILGIGGIAFYISRRRKSL